MRILVGGARTLTPRFTALGAIAAADFFTTEVWNARGLVTYYTAFPIEMASRRVHLLGPTPHPDDRFVQQVARTLTDVALRRCAAKTRHGAQHP